MVAEARAQRLDLAAKVEFVKPGREITETRAQLEDELADAADVAARRTVVALENLTGAG